MLRVSAVCALTLVLLGCESVDRPEDFRKGADLDVAKQSIQLPEKRLPGGGPFLEITVPGLHSQQSQRDAVASLDRIRSIQRNQYGVDDTAAGFRTVRVCRSRLGRGQCGNAGFRLAAKRQKGSRVPEIDRASRPANERLHGSGHQQRCEHSHNSSGFAGRDSHYVL